MAKVSFGSLKLTEEFKQVICDLFKGSFVIHIKRNYPNQVRMPCKCCGNDCRCTAACGQGKPCTAECNCNCKCKQETGKDCCESGCCKK